jgi:hypothetical protein
MTEEDLDGLIDELKKVRYLLLHASKICACALMLPLMCDCHCIKANTKPLQCRIIKRGFSRLLQVAPNAVVPIQCLVTRNLPVPPEKLFDGNASRSDRPSNHGGVTSSSHCQKSLAPAHEPSEVAARTSPKEDSHVKDSESTDGESTAFLERSAPVAPQEDSLLQESSSSVSIEVIPDMFGPGDFIEVAARTSPGMNKPGGVGTIKKVDSDKRCLDVKYTLGGMDRNVPFNLCTHYDFCVERQKRSPKKGGGGKIEHPHLRPTAGGLKRSATQGGFCSDTRAPKCAKKEKRRFSAEEDSILDNALAEIGRLHSQPEAPWSEIALLLDRSEKSLQSRSRPFEIHRIITVVCQQVWFNFVVAGGTNILDRRAQP